MTDWFTRAESGLRHVTSYLHPHGTTMGTGTPQAPAPAGGPVSLTDTAHAIKTAIENAEVNVRTVLDEHMPGLVAFIERADADPLIAGAITIAEDALLPPEAKPILAEILHRLAYTYRQPAAPQPAVPAPVVPAEQVDPLPEGQAAA